MPLKDRKAAQAAAKKSWLSRDLPNWRSQVDDLLKGKQIIVNDRREWNSIYVAAKRKWVRALCVKISDSQFASFPISSNNQVPSCSAFNLCLHESEFERIQ